MSLPLSVFSQQNMGLNMANQGAAAIGGNTSMAVDATWGTGAAQNSAYNSAANAVAQPTMTSLQGYGSVANNTALNNSVKGSEDIAKQIMDHNQKYWDSPMGKAEPYLKGANSIASTFGSLANIYLGFQQMGIMKEQLGMAKEQWAEQKKELNHVRGVRKRLSAAYMA